MIKPGEHVSSGNVNIGDRLRGNDQPFRWLRRLCDIPSHVLAKSLRIREKGWRIPANQQKAGNLFCFRVSYNIVITRPPLDLAQNGVVRVSRAPDK